MDLDQYAFVPYIDKGRSMNGADCWGIVRLVLHREHGINDLPEFGDVGRKQLAEMTAGYEQTRRLFAPTRPIPSAVAACFDTDGNFVHCGIVEQSGSCLHVLHSTADSGVVVELLRNFVGSQRMQGRTIEYYRYVG